MKKNLFLLLLAFVLPLFSVSIFAEDINTPLFATFEDGNTAPFILNAEGEGSDMKTQSITDNPLKEINTSSKAIKLEAPAGVDWWHKTYLKIQDGTAIVPASENHKYLHIFMMSPTGTSGIEVGVYSADGTMIYQSASINWDSASGWKDVVLDLSDSGDKPGIAGNNIGGIWIRPFGAAAGKIYYFDQFELSASNTPRLPSDITTPLFGTFEDGTPSPFVLNANSDYSNIKTQTITDNPLKEINTTDKAIQLTIEEGIDWWHKTYLKVQDGTAVVPASEDHKYLHIFMMSPTGTVGIEVGVLNTAGTTIYQSASLNWDSADGWKDIVLDLSDSGDKPGIAGNNIGGIWMRPFGASVGKIYYFDQFELSASADPRLPSNITTPLFATFNDGNAYPFVLNAEGPGSEMKVQSIVDNPLKTLNTTDKCILLDVPANAEWWHKTYLKVENGTTILPASPDHKYLHFYAMCPAGFSGAEIGVYNTAGEMIYQKGINFGGVYKWKDVIFDLSTDLGENAGIVGNNIGGIWIRPYVPAGNPCYFDEFELSDSPDFRIKTFWGNPTLVTFEENSSTPFSFAIDGGTLDTVKENPDTEGINNSAVCIYGDYSAGMDWWYKIKMDASAEYIIEPKTADHKYLHFLVYRDVIGRSEVQVYDGENPEARIYQRQFSNRTTNTWEEIVLDLTSSEADLAGISGKTISNIWIMTNLDGGAGHFYYDSFVLSDSKEPIGLVQTLTDLGNFENNWEQPIMSAVTQTSGATATITDNPLTTDKLNKTANVLKYERPAGAEWWHSLSLYMDGFIGVEAPNTYLHFMMYNPAQQKIAVVINNVAGEEFSREIEPTQNTAWEDYVIDLVASFTEPVLSNIRTINIRIPEDASANTYYFDEFVINEDANPRTPDVNIDNLKATDIHVTANNGFAQIEGNDIASVELYGINGALLQTKMVNGSGKILLPLPGNGVYLVKVIRTNGSTVICKVVK